MHVLTDDTLQQDDAISTHMVYMAVYVDFILSPCCEPYLCTLSMH